MRMQFRLEVYVYRRWTGFICHKPICHYWAVDYFHCFFNEMLKLLNHSSHIVRIEKDWKYRLKDSDDLLVELIEKSDAFH